MTEPSTVPGDRRPSYVGARAYADPDHPDHLSLYAVTDTFANLGDSTRCVIQAALVLAGLLDGDTIVTEAAAEAQQAWGTEIALWPRK